MAIYTDVVNTQIAQMAGLRCFQYATADSDGFPNGKFGSLAQGAAAGMGIHVGVKQAGGQAPDPREVDATGDDGTYEMGFLFGGAGTGKLDIVVAPYNGDFLTAATGTKTHIQGEWNTFGEETNADPNRATMSLLFNIFARDADTLSGDPRWANLFYPLVAVAPKFSTHKEVDVAEMPYTGKPARSARYPWGLAFSTSNNGFTRAAKVRLFSRLPLTMHTLIGNGAVNTITLDYSPASDDTGFVCKVFKEGVELTKTTGFTVNVGLKKVTLAVTPAAGERVVVVYESFDLL